MKNLKITYGDAVLWDAPVGSLEWHDSDNGVKVEGRVKSKPASSGSAARSGGLLEMLSKASKANGGVAKRNTEAAKRNAEASEAYEVAGVAERNTGITGTEPEPTEEESVGE